MRDDAQGNFTDKLMEPAEEEGHTFEERNDKDLCLPEENHQLEPDFTEKAEVSECPDKGTCGYHVFPRPRIFICACWLRIFPSVQMRDSRTACRFRRGHLSSIHGCCANNFLVTLLKTHVSNSAYVWIGVIKTTRWARYCNVDRSGLNYTNWACGNPKTRKRWCVAMNRLSEYRHDRRPHWIINVMD
ncbi:proteoglycan 3-like [Leptodactylus fuscus]|uniref:proteoglycan 3-like n=1 Tax=Leptodactylus fuscus TaxID=238119 RepID=UPI003F4E75E0